MSLWILELYQFYFSSNIEIWNWDIHMVNVWIVKKQALIFSRNIQKRFGIIFQIPCAYNEFQNCHFECLIKEVYKKCKCRPPYLPTNAKNKYVNFFKSNLFTLTLVCRFASLVHMSTVLLLSWWNLIIPNVIVWHHVKPDFKISTLYLTS